jgi:hypothetical protein
MESDISSSPFLLFLTSQNYGESSFVLDYHKFVMPTNGWLTCPAVMTQDLASNYFSPHPQVGGSAAPAGSG